MVQHLSCLDFHGRYRKSDNRGFDCCYRIDGSQGIIIANPLWDLFDGGVVSHLTSELFQIQSYKMGRGPSNFSDVPFAPSFSKERLSGK